MPANLLAGSNGSAESNIKTDYQKTKERPGFRFSRPYNPVPAQIRDAGEYARFFGDYGKVWVPYAGTDKFTSHSLLNFLISLGDLSPTKSAILTGRRRYLFGGAVDIARKVDPVFNIESDPTATESEKQAYSEFFRGTVRLRDAAGELTNIRQFAAFIDNDLTRCGNAWIEVIKTETTGVRTVFLDLLPPEMPLYFATEPGAERWVGISPYWNVSYINANPPRPVPVWPNEVKDKAGNSRSIFHIRNGNYPFYGRPHDIAGFLYQYFEFQNVDYLNKMTASQFTGQTIIEVEDGDPNAGAVNSDDGPISEGFDDFAGQLERNFTNKGDDFQTVIITNRAAGSSPLTVFQFAPNTNHEWYKVTNQEAERQILKTGGWPRRFTGLDSATGLSTNLFLDEFEIASKTIIPDGQRAVSEPLNILLTDIANWSGHKIGVSHSIEFSSPYKEMITERKENERNNPNTV